MQKKINMKNRVLPGVLAAVIAGAGAIAGGRVAQAQGAL